LTKSNVSDTRRIFVDGTIDLPGGFEMSVITKPLVFYIPDTRGVVQSRYGAGNLKIGLGCSPTPGCPAGLAGRPSGPAERRRSNATSEARLGRHVSRPDVPGTCPGSTPECESICYASRPVAEAGPVLEMWRRNSVTDEVPPIPEEAKLLRLHISGDFDSVDVHRELDRRLTERPDVTCWAYTGPGASRTAAGPRTPARTAERHAARVDGRLDTRPCRRTAGAGPGSTATAGRQGAEGPGAHGGRRGHHGLGSGEDQGRRQESDLPGGNEGGPNCEACKYCFEGARNDVTFLEH
jgi:hypothetical protein